MSSIIDTVTGPLHEEYEEITVPTGEEVTPATWSSLSPAEKRKIEEQIAEQFAVLPNPLISPSDFITIMGRAYTVADLLGAISRNGKLGITEDSIILSVLAAWQKNVQEIAEANEEDAKRKALDPFRQAFKDFIERKDVPSSAGVADLMQVLRSSPLLLSGVRNIDAATLTTAYQKAEGIVITDILNRYVSASAQRETWLKEQSTLTPEANTSIQMLANYLKDVSNGTQSLEQPLVSIMVAGVASGQNVQVGLLLDPKTNQAFINPNVASVLPLGQDLVFNATTALGAQLPITVDGGTGLIALNMAQFMLNIQDAARMLALPGAFTLAQQPDALTSTNKTSEASVRSYAIMIERFAMSPQFEAFVKNLLLQLGPDKVSPSIFQTYLTTLRTILFTNALAALDKTFTGGVVIRKEDIKGLLDGSISVAGDDVRSALVTLIRTELTRLPDAARAQLMQTLFTYIDSNPAVAALADPVTAMLESFDPKMFFLKQAAHSA